MWAKQWYVSFDFIHEMQPEKATHSFQACVCVRLCEQMFMIVCAHIHLYLKENFEICHQVWSKGLMQATIILIGQVVSQLAAAVIP